MPPKYPLCGIQIHAQTATTSCNAGSNVPCLWWIICEKVPDTLVSCVNVDDVAVDGDFSRRENLDRPALVDATSVDGVLEVEELGAAQDEESTNRW